MDQHLPTLHPLRTNELDSAVDHLDRRRLEVGRRKMEEGDAGGPQGLIVITILAAKIDDRSNTVRFCELGRAFDWKASANGQLRRQPMEIRDPGFGYAQRLFVIILLSIIFFFINPPRVLLLFGPLYCCCHSQERNNKA